MTRPTPPVRPFRLAFLTDLHLWPDGGWAEAGCLRALAHAERQGAQLIVLGGDLIMDALPRRRDEVEAQWTVFQRVMAAPRRVPLRCVLGNHDHWGHPDHASDPDWGKAWALRELGLTTPYSAFTVGGWKVILLDSTEQHGDQYLARLDEGQWRWLLRELQGTPPELPVVVVSHIPILSAAVFMDGPNERADEWRVPGGWMHLDARALGDMFLAHPQVKLCLSGHLHLYDRVLYNRVTYLCGGSVCGAWWQRDNPNYHETPPGYLLLDLWPNGRFEAQYLPYDGTAPDPS